MKSIKQTRNLSYVVQVGTGTPGMLEFGMLIVTVVFFLFFSSFYCCSCSLVGEKLFSPPGEPRHLSTIPIIKRHVC
jgi:hypothetical protein